MRKLFYPLLLLMSIQAYGQNPWTPYTTSTGLRSGVVGTPDAVILIDKQGYTFKYNSSNTTAADDSAMIIRYGSRRYERVTDFIRPEFWGGNPSDLLDDTKAIQKAFDFGTKDVFFSAGTWLGHGIDARNSNITGNSNGSTTLKVNGGTEFFILGWDTPHWRQRVISNVKIDGNDRSYDGVRYYTSTYKEISGRWTFQNVVFENCNRAIYKPNGNIGNLYERCYFGANNFGYYAIGTGNPTYMHAGFDTFRECTWNTTYKAGIYIDSPVPGTGGTVMERPHFELNPGFCIFVKNYPTAYTPIQLDQFWSEINATAANVDIDGVNYVPKDIRFENCMNFQVTNSAIGPIEIINSNGQFDNTHFSFNGYTQEIDSLSSVTVTNLVADAVKLKYLTLSIRNVHRPVGNFGIVINAPHRLPISKNKPAILNIPFNTSVTMGGNVAGIIGTVAAGGPSGDSYNRYAMPPGQQNLTSTTNIATGKYYVATVAIRQISDVVPEISLTYGISMANGLHTILKKGKWITTATVGRAELSGTVGLYFNSSSLSSSATFDLQALQIVEFSTEQEAFEFYRQAIY